MRKTEGQPKTLISGGGLNVSWVQPCNINE